MSAMFCQVDSPRTSLDVDETHVYECAIEGAESLIDSLTEAERERALRFRVERMRQQFIVARGRLRSLLAGYLGVLPCDVPLCYEENGKPHLPESYGLQFNLSHADGLAVFAFARSLVGIDVEKVRSIPDAEHLVERFFSHREHAEFLAIEPGLRPTAFLRAWTRKEAVLKAIGRGVLSLDTCEVSFAANEPARLRCLDGDMTAGEGWRLEAWEPREGYMAALAIHKSF